MSMAYSTDGQRVMATTCRSYPGSVAWSILRATVKFNEVHDGAGAGRGDHPCQRHERVGLVLSGRSCVDRDGDRHHDGCHDEDEQLRDREVRILERIVEVPVRDEAGNKGDDIRDAEHEVRARRPKPKTLTKVVHLDGLPSARLRAQGHVCRRWAPTQRRPRRRGVPVGAAVQSSEWIGERRV